MGVPGLTLTVLSRSPVEHVPPSERPLRFLEGLIMHSDSILRGLSVASYILTVVICVFLYKEVLTPWTFVVLFLFIWTILAGVVMHRSAKQAERETAQKMFQVLSQEAKSKEGQELVSRMMAKFPSGGKVN